MKNKGGSPVSPSLSSLFQYLVERYLGTSQGQKVKDLQGIYKKPLKYWRKKSQEPKRIEVYISVCVFLSQGLREDDSH